MASAISSDPGDRQSLSTFRTMGGMLAGMVIGIGLPMVAYEKIPLADGTIKEAGKLDDVLKTAGTVTFTGCIIDGTVVILDVPAYK